MHSEILNAIKAHDIKKLHEYTRSGVDILTYMSNQKDYPKRPDFETHAIVYAVNQNAFEIFEYLLSLIANSKVPAQVLRGALFLAFVASLEFSTVFVNDDDKQNNYNKILELILNVPGFDCNYVGLMDGYDDHVDISFIGSLLQHAAEQGHYVAFNLLISHQARYAPPDESHTQRILMAACSVFYTGMMSIKNFLGDEDYRSTPEYMRVPERLKIIRQALLAGLNINGIDAAGYSVLYYAIFGVDPSVSFDSYLKTPTHSAILKLLIEQGVDINANYQDKEGNNYANVIDLALKMRCPLSEEIVRMLLDAGIETKTTNIKLQSFNPNRQEENEGYEYEEDEIPFPAYDLLIANKAFNHFKYDPPTICKMVINMFVSQYQKKPIQLDKLEAYLINLLTQFLTPELELNYIKLRIIKSVEPVLREFIINAMGALIEKDELENNLPPELQEICLDYYHQDAGKKYPIANLFIPLYQSTSSSSSASVSCVTQLSTIEADNAEHDSNLRQNKRKREG